MNENVKQVSQALTQFDTVSAGIAQLREAYVGVVYDVDSAPGMDAARVARAAIREPRYMVERVRKDAKKPLLALGKQLDAEAARITDELLKLESPIDSQIKAQEQREETERAEKIEAELARVKALQDRTEVIRLMPMRAAGKSAADVALILDGAESIQIGDDFQEFADVARVARNETVMALRAILAERIKYEDEQKRIAEERKELERLRAEAVEREAAQRARRTEEETRIAREREDLTRQQQELARAREQYQRDTAQPRNSDSAVPAAVTPAESKPSPGPAVAAADAVRPAPHWLALVEVIANHYQVSRKTALRWLQQSNFSEIK